MLTKILEAKDLGTTTDSKDYSACCIILNSALFFTVNLFFTEGICSVL